MGLTLVSQWGIMGPMQDPSAPTESMDQTCCPLGTPDMLVFGAVQTLDELRAELDPAYPAPVAAVTASIRIPKAVGATD